jgi:hypothetical protein
MFKRVLAKLGFGSNRFQIQREWGVTRLDELETYVSTLMGIHPELQNHPAILDLRDRQKACREELERP